MISIFDHILSPHKIQVSIFQLTNNLIRDISTKLISLNYQIHSLFYFSTKLFHLISKGLFRRLCKSPRPRIDWEHRRQGDSVCSKTYSRRQLACAHHDSFHLNRNHPAIPLWSGQIRVTQNVSHDEKKTELSSPREKKVKVNKVLIFRAPTTSREQVVQSSLRFARGLSSVRFIGEICRNKISWFSSKIVCVRSKIIEKLKNWYF